MSFCVRCNTYGRTGSTQNCTHTHLTRHCIPISIIPLRCSKVTERWFHFKMICMIVIWYSVHSSPETRHIICSIHTVGQNPSTGRCQRQQDECQCHFHRWQTVVLDSVIGNRCGQQIGARNGANRCVRVSQRRVLPAVPDSLHQAQRVQAAQQRRVPMLQADRRPALREGGGPATAGAEARTWVYI